MTKKIAVINDLSGFGRCSLTAAISVISAMGVQACPLPTALLTAQTGFPSYYCDDYTGKMEHYRREWAKMQVQFHGIYTGFVANEAQITHIFEFLNTFRQGSTFLLVDPVMGDNGATYGIYTEQLRQQMRTLAETADITTPNLTELCLLTGADYKAIPMERDPALLFQKIEDLGKQLCQKGTGAVVVTGIRFNDPQTGRSKIGNMHITRDSREMSAFPDLGGSYSGTGDLFASVLAGGTVRGDTLTSSIQLAGKFLEDALGDSAKEQVPYNEGVNYEKFLGQLLPSQAL